MRGFTCYNCTTEFATAKEAAEHVLNAPACFDAQDLEDIASAGFANFYVGVRVSGHAARAVAKKIRGST